MKKEEKNTKEYKDKTTKEKRFKKYEKFLYIKDGLKTETTQKKKRKSYNPGYNKIEYNLRTITDT